MMSLKAVAASAALAIAAVSAPGIASAATITDIEDGSGTFSQSRIAAGSFSTDFTYDVATAGLAKITLSYTLIGDGLQSLKFFFNGTEIATTPITGTTDQFSGGFTSNVAAGTQTITVSGISNGKNANYSGTAVFSAVPEPTSWALMMFGFGAAGVALRRRNTRTAVKYSFA